MYVIMENTTYVQIIYVATYIVKLITTSCTITMLHGYVTGPVLYLHKIGTPICIMPTIAYPVASYVCLFSL